MKGKFWYDNCPYLIILNLKVRIELAFWEFEVEED